MNKSGNFLAILAILALSAFYCHTLMAMSSTNYYINWDSINIGGTDYSSSTNYYISDTIGEISTGWSSSTNYWISSGYRLPDENPRYIEFTLSAQDNSTKISYSAFNNAGNQATLSDSTGYLVGEYIAVVENEGASQMVSIGKITNVGGGGVITVDKWEGDNAAMSAIPAGSNDWVYEISGHTLDLNTLVTLSVNTGVSRTEVHTNAPDGYTVTIVENQDLSSGADTIDDVSDGVVTAGFEEYGIETTGPTAQGAGDWAITTTGQIIQSSTAEADHERIAVIYKASKNMATVEGTYSHVTTYYVTANF